jgi:hypothetical protein
MSRWRAGWWLAGLLVAGGRVLGQEPGQVAQAPDRPVPVIFDTDIGNDCDDVLAMSMLHSLASRHEVELLAVTITKDNPLAARYVSALNTYYNRPTIPIGLVRQGKTPEAGKFLPLADKKVNGQYLYPRALSDSAEVPDGVTVLRQTLARAKDRSVSVVQVGFSTNLARLLDSPADAASPLAGRDLVKAKVKELSIMAGAFQKIDGKVHKEYNVVEDISSCRKLAEQWPTPIFWSGFEVGLAVTYPAESILRDYAYTPKHLVAESYIVYEPPPHNRPCWDLTSALFVARPERGYFGLSKPGRVTVKEDGETLFTEDPNGRDRYLTVTREQAARTREAFSHLCSEPPHPLPRSATGGR